jgi:hypothetical protein
MDPPSALRDAVAQYIKTRDNPSIEARDGALVEVAQLLENIVRDGLQDRELAASLDGLAPRNVTSDGANTLNVTGLFWTLGIEGGDLVLPMEAELSLHPEAASLVRVAGRGDLLEPPDSERRFQRALASAVWQQTFDLRVA